MLSSGVNIHEQACELFLDSSCEPGSFCPAVYRMLDLRSFTGKSADFQIWTETGSCAERQTDGVNVLQANGEHELLNSSLGF